MTPAPVSLATPATSQTAPAVKCPVHPSHQGNLFKSKKLHRRQKNHLVIMYRSSHSSDGSVETVVGQDVSVNKVDENSFDLGLMAGHKSKRERARCAVEQEALGHLHCQRQRCLKGKLEGQH